MYGPSRTGSGIVDADALCNSLRNLPVEAAFVQVNNYLRLHREHAKDFFRVCFPVLLQRIFGFEDHAPGGPIPAPAPSAGGWLQQASGVGKEAEARALLSSLDPGGVLLQALLAVDRDTSVRFLFPPARLPDWVRRLLATAQGAQLLSEQAPVFQGHIMQDPTGRFQVHLDLFHYYLFWFAYYVVCKDTAASRNTRQAQVQAAQGGFPARRLDPWPALKLPGLPSPSAPPAAPIRDLLRRYLRYFLPYSAPAMLAPPPPTSIFRTLSRAGSGTPEGNTPQVAHERRAPLSPGATLLHTLLAFWLCDDDPAPLSAADHRFTQPTALPLYGGPAPYSYPPSGEDLLDSLQILVTHVDANPQLAALEGDAPAPRGGSRPTFERALSGSFRTTVPGGTQPTYNSPPLPPASAVLQRPLYRLILRALLGWPIQNGGLSKISKVVDIWAGHLQPWGAQQQQQPPPRQGGFNLHRSSSGAGSGGQQGQSPPPAYGDKWRGYVLAHYAFYNPLVVHLLEWAFRAVAVDAGGTARVVNKVLSVLQSPPLLELLRQVEAAYAGHVAARHAPGQQANLCIKLEEQMRDWESGLVQPAPLLGGITPAGQPPRLRLFAAEDDGGPRLLQGLLHRVQSEAAAPRGGGQGDSLKQLAGLAHSIVVAAGEDRRGGHPPGAQKQPAGNRGEQARAEPPSGPGEEASARRPARPVVGLQRHTWADAHYKGDWMRRPLEAGEIGWLVRRLVRLSEKLNDLLQIGPQAEAEEQQAERERRRGEETNRTEQEQGGQGSTAGGRNKGAGVSHGGKEQPPRETEAEGAGTRGDGAEGTRQAGQHGSEEADVGVYEDALPLPMVAYRMWKEVQAWSAGAGRSLGVRLQKEARRRHWRVNLRPLGEVQSIVVMALLAMVIWLIRLVIRCCSG